MFFWVNLGKKKYILVKKYIPIFISKKLAKEIYTIGRTLNFIRVCCNDHDWNAMDSLMSFEMNNKFVNNELFNFENITFSQMNELEYKISELSKITNERLMSLIMNKFNFMMHATALKQYLLLGQGDFIQQFLGDIRNDLNNHASYIKQHNIQSKLELAMLNSNAQFDMDDVKSRIKVKITPVKFICLCFVCFKVRNILY